MPASWGTHIYRILVLVAFSVVLSFTVQVKAVRAQQSQQLMPYIGETEAEFEARKAGLPKPATPPDEASVAVFADPQGSYFVQVAVNGTPIRMIVDTGANVVALTESDAQSVGLAVSQADYRIKILTANGSEVAAPASLSKVVIGGIEVDNVQAVVVPDSNLSISLLGMSFLSKLSYFNESNGKLVLKR